ncbi:MAG TPA: sensor histidine kinase [Verrucomicrobiae bacterium]|nr:sensor histidine kinase [Verrucomicrobiae bacterium]HEX4264160.1 sensor histidine kinase [Verrucomicrobiae bacterium]
MKNLLIKPFSLAAVRMLAWILMAVPLTARSSVLWNRPETQLVCDNGTGEDILNGAIKPQDANSSATLYFRFRVDPIADSAIKSIGDYNAGLVFFEKNAQHLGLGSSRQAWAYCAMNVTNSEKGYVDLNSATREPGFNWEYIRAGTHKYIAFRIDYVAGHEARVTAWLNPDLSLNATEINQPTNLVTRFEGNATFDEIHLLHDGRIGGWKFSEIIGATSFEDLRLTHFWQGRWFLAAVSGGLLALVVGTVQLVERRRASRNIQRLEKETVLATERARIARDIHDELGASLTKIQKLADVMKQNGKGVENLGELPEVISETACDSIRAMDEIVWAVNPRNDTLKELADYLVYFTEDFLRQTGIACTLDVPLKLPDFPVAAEVRHNLYMVVKEALNNAVKHAAASQIKFGLDFSGDRLTLFIQDNGRGFCRDEIKRAGNGLENMQKRLSAIGGTLALQSTPDTGTSLLLSVAMVEHKMSAS